MPSRRRCSWSSSCGVDAVDTGDLPALLRVVPGRHGPVLELRSVLDDPIDVLVGRIAPADTLAVGLRAPAHIHHLDTQRPATPGRVLHLVTTTGTSVTLLPATEPVERFIGPTGAPLIGRVPEACRRQLGLPTPPPPPVEVTTIVDLWLTRLTAAAVRGDAAHWTDAVALLPAAPGPTVTPADAARALHHAAARWSWEQLRRAAEGGSTGWVAGCLDAATAGWMDEGMFARWIIGELPSAEILLEVLDATTGPATADRLRAAAHLAANIGGC